MSLRQPNNFDINIKNNSSHSKHAHCDSLSCVLSEHQFGLIEANDQQINFSTLSCPYILFHNKVDSNCMSPQKTVN